MKINSRIINHSNHNKDAENENNAACDYIKLDQEINLEQ